MRVSEPIFPIRFYNDFSNQARFDKFCETNCDTNLIYPPNGIPHFQFKRGTSLLQVDRFFLRNVCSDAEANYYKRLPEYVANLTGRATEELTIPTKGFVTESSGYILPIAEFSCDKIKSIYRDPEVYVPSGADPEMVIIPGGLACMQRFKVVIDKFVSPTLTIQVIDASGVKLSITQQGSYTVDFIPSGDISLKFLNYTGSDEFEISYVQSQVIDISCFASYTSDVNIDQTKIKILTLNDGNDVVVYCEGNPNYEITPGDYYYFVRCSDSRGGGGGILTAQYQFFFSEVFTIKSVKDVEDYYKLTWRNSCDIGNKAIYNILALSGCQFVNSVYVNNSALTRPEYPVTKDTAQNGFNEQKNLQVTWKKTIGLEIPVAPEFLTDALTSIVLHDTIKITEPLSRNQERLSFPQQVIEISSENTPTMNECFQAVNLIITLEETFVNSSCCNQAELLGDHYYKYEASDDCSHNYKLQLTEIPTIGDGLIKCSDDTIQPVKPLDIIRDYENDRYLRLELLDGIWQVSRIFPQITEVDDSDASHYHVRGYIIPFTVGVLQLRKNMGSWIDAGPSATSTDDSGFIEIIISKSIDAGTEHLDFRFANKTLTTNIGTSPTFPVY